jgi:hypothetical protein
MGTSLHIPVDILHSKPVVKFDVAQVVENLQGTRDFGWTQRSIIVNVPPGALTARLEFEFLTGSVS